MSSSGIGSFVVHEAFMVIAAFAANVVVPDPVPLLAVHRVLPVVTFVSGVSGNTFVPDVNACMDTLAAVPADVMPLGTAVFADGLYPNGISHKETVSAVVPPARPCPLNVKNTILPTLVNAGGTKGGCPAG